jgi:hypothetical protein
VTVGGTAHLARFAHALLGGQVARAMGGFMRSYFARAKPAPMGNGSLFESPSNDASISGGWR